MANSITFLKEEFRKKVRRLGMNEERIEEICRTFEKYNKHIDAISLVILLERFGIDRKNITDFLKDIAIDDSTIINIFGKVDVKKTELSGAREISNVVIDE